LIVRAGTHGGSGSHRRRAAGPLALACLALAGCGLEMQQPDLFLIRRAGEGHAVSVVINSDGTVTCDRRRTGTLGSARLINARALQPAVHRLALHRLRIGRAPNSVFTYTVRVDSGTISFPDTAGVHDHTLAQLELLDAQAEQVACGSS
jgi:hypothetical protein